MSAAVSPILAPDEAAMRSHLDFLFGGYLHGFQDGLVELAWTTSEPGEDGRYRLSNAEMFDLDDDSLDRLVARAIEVNSRPRTNVYIGAALRKPGTARDRRANDADAYCMTAAWCDLDDQDANENASAKFKAAPPSLVVRTGQHPHKRHQCWWRLDEPVADPERIRAIVNGISARLSGDSSVSNPSRVMRLAGSIAWDQKPGRRPEITGIIPLKKPGLPSYLPEHIEREYPPLYCLAAVREHRGAPGPNLGVVREKGSLGLATGKVVDGREKHMTAVICARLIDYCGQFGAVPTPDELYEHAWDVYERSTDLDTRPGRGRNEFMEKCRSTMRRFETGKIRGIESLEVAVASYQNRRSAKRENVRHEAERGRADPDEFAAASDVYEFLDIAGIKALPDPRWVVDKLIIEDALGFIYGPPGHYKTFVALSLAMHVAYGASSWWWGRAIKRPGLVLYLAQEGQAGLKARIEAFQRTHDIASDDAAFALVRSSINFLDENDIDKLLRTIEAAAQRFGAEPALVFVDTVSRVMPGADENLQKEMTLFVRACDAVRGRFGATVVGVHHAGKSGDMRGSTVLKGAGDFVFRVEKEEGQDESALTAKFEAEKIKDAEDGWTKPLAVQAVHWTEEGKVDGERMSLVVTPGKEAEERQGAGRDPWPEKAVCRKILAAMQEAWAVGRPWSHHPQAKRDQRYAPERITRQFGVSARTAEHMVTEWLANDVLAVAVADKRNQTKGLQVVGMID